MNILSITAVHLLLSVTTIAVLTVVLAGIDIAAESWANPLDTKVSKRFARMRTKSETKLMRGLSWLGGPYGIITSILLFVLYLGVEGKNKEAILFIFLTGLATIYVLLIKLVTARKRPHVKALEVERTYSFPSAHSFISTLVYLSVAVTLGQYLGLTIPIISIALLLILSIGISRIYLGCHYLTDVLGGWVGGTVWVTLFLWLAAQYT